MDSVNDTENFGLWARYACNQGFDEELSIVRKSERLRGGISSLTLHYVIERSLREPISGHRGRRKFSVTDSKRELSI